MVLALGAEGRKPSNLSALFDEPAGGRELPACLLAHGAGLHMESPTMAAVAGGLAARGFPVLRFNYPYRERALAEKKRNRPPDPTRILEEAHGLALEALRERTGEVRPLLVGKTLGARIGSYLAAKDAPCRGLISLGYPLHAPNKPEELRSEHFAAIAQPALFLQGTRDPFCDLGLLQGTLRTFGGTATVTVIEGADHGFHVPKASGRTRTARSGLETRLG